MTKKKNTELLAWCYRIIDHGDECISIHETFVNYKTGKFYSHSELPLCTASNRKNLMWQYKRMGEAFKHRSIKAQERRNVKRS